MGEAGLDDFSGRKRVLTQRLLVTRQTHKFLDDVPVLDMGLIGLDALPEIDVRQSYHDNTTPKMISTTITECALTFERSAFVLMVRADGRHTFWRLA